MTTENDGNIKVTYTVKELFSEVLTKLGAMDAKLDSKASVAEVASLRDGLTALEKRVLVQETDRGGRIRNNALWIPIAVQIAGIIALIYVSWPKH